MNKEPIYDCKFKMAKQSGWVCYLFGSSDKSPGLKYYPTKGNVPNFFIRWMMRVCLGCRWENLK
jgi:hypothetical protein